jgi:hypothetical protein
MRSKQKMNKPKKLNRKQRSAIRKSKIAAGTYVAPAKRQPKKKTEVSSARRVKPKASPAPGARLTKAPATGTAAVSVNHPCGTAAGAHPEFAVADRQRPFIPHRHYWTGGTVLPRITHLKIPSGFVLSTDPAPGPDFRIAHVKVLRTAPEGETVKLVRWVMRDAAHAELARRAAAVLAEIREDERRDERNKLAVQRLLARVCGRGRTR